MDVSLYLIELEFRNIPRELQLRKWTKIEMFVSSTEEGRIGELHARSISARSLGWNVYKKQWKGASEEGCVAESVLDFCVVCR